MLAGFKRVRPSAGVLRKLGMVGFVAGVAALAFFWGRHGVQRAAAQTPDGIRGDPLGPRTNSDYSRRVVAFTHGNVPITREDLGEYLIARYGAQRLEFLVNRRIIEMACRANQITVSDAEVDTQLKQDVAGFGLSGEQFVNGILKRYGKTLYEWREDVIRPKLALAKFCRGRPEVQVTEADLQKAFEAHYGEKIECRMLVLQAQVGKMADDIWQKVRDSDEAFDKYAKQQFIPQLASQSGKIPPIHKHFGDPAIEKAAFALTTPGQISELLGMPDKTFVILKLVRRIPPELGHDLNKERLTLHKEMEEYKLSQEIPKVFAQLKTQARPNLLLKGQPSTEETERQVREMIRDVPGYSNVGGGQHH